MKTFTSLVFTLFLVATCFSQAQIRFAGNVGISFANGTMANPIYLVVDNPNANAITDDDATAGGPAILSESEYHIVKWNIGSNTGTYNVPFISTTGGGAEYVAPSVTITGAGDAAGHLEFATYNHDNTVANAPSDVTHMDFALTGAAGGENEAMDRFWIIDPDSYTTKPNASIAFTYDEDELDGTMTEPALLIQRFNPTSFHWLDYNMTGHPVNGALNIAGAAPVPAVQFFRSWTITNATNPLPIELLSFSSECKGDGIVELTWSTASEVNNAGFSLERSEDGIIWETFAENIHGAGNSSTQQDYSYLDNNPFRGLTYYRLTQTDFDGTSETFDPVVNDCDGVGFELISAYSPDGTQYIQLAVSAAYDETFDIEVLDMSGKSSLFRPNVRLLEGLNYFNLDKSSLGYGMYIIRLQSENELMTRKILLN